MKYLLAKYGGKADSSAFVEGLLAYRATPRNGGLSPAHLVFGKAPRTRVLQIAEARTPKVSVDDHVAKTAKVADAVKARYDASARDLASLAKGARVYVQSEQDGRWRKRGTVIQVRHKRDYVVRMDDGGNVRRNRHKLRLTTDVEGLDQLQGRSSSASSTSSSSTSTSTTASSPALNTSAASSRAKSKAPKRSTSKKSASSSAKAPPRRSKRVAFSQLLTRS